MIQMEECPLCGKRKQGPDRYELYCGRCEKMQGEVMEEVNVELVG